MEAISGFSGELGRNCAGDFFIDEITRNDLDMDKVFRRINNTQSTVGPGRGQVARSSGE